MTLLISRLRHTTIHHTVQPSPSAQFMANSLTSFLNSNNSINARPHLRLNFTFMTAFYQVMTANHNNQLRITLQINRRTFITNINIHNSFRRAKLKSLTRLIPNRRIQTLTQDTNRVRQLIRQHISPKPSQHRRHIPIVNTRRQRSTNMRAQVAIIRARRSNFQQRFQTAITHNRSLISNGQFMIIFTRPHRLLSRTLNTRHSRHLVKIAIFSIIMNSTRRIIFQPQLFISQRQTLKKQHRHQNLLNTNTSRRHSRRGSRAQSGERFRALLRTRDRISRRTRVNFTVTIVEPISSHRRATRLRCIVPTVTLTMTRRTSTNNTIVTLTMDTHANLRLLTPKNFMATVRRIISISHQRRTRI